MCVHIFQPASHRIAANAIAIAIGLNVKWAMVQTECCSIYLDVINRRETITDFSLKLLLLLLPFFQENVILFFFCWHFDGMMRKIQFPFIMFGIVHLLVLSNENKRLDTLAKLKRKR